MLSNYPIQLANGEIFNPDVLTGKVILIVNVASKCGFTPQYQGLEALYQTYKDRGFLIIAFPCNQFAQQEPESDQKILDFCQLNYGVSFPISQKIDVNGPHEAPLYTWLKSEQGGFLVSRIKWNFTKFLINPSGKVVARYAPTTKPEKLRAKIEKLLA